MYDRGAFYIECECPGCEVKHTVGLDGVDDGLVWCYICSNDFRSIGIEKWLAGESSIG